MIRLASLGLFVAMALLSCSPNGASVPEAEYTAKIAGDWMGTVGDDKENISFSPSGAFVSQVRQKGFISNTLGQGVTGTVRGTWAIKGKVITLKIGDGEDIRVRNKTTTSRIEKFKSDEIVVKSESGETSTFVR
jgi:hypothetical protein